MNWFPFVTNGVIGGTTGFCLMTIALLFRTRQVAKNGLYVDTKYIQQSPYLHGLLRQVTLSCKTGRLSVSENYKEFITAVDRLVGMALRGEKYCECPESLLQLLKSAYVNDPPAEAVNQQLTAAVYQIVQHGSQQK